MALNPWPTSPAALAAAITLLRSLIGDPEWIKVAGGTEIDTAGLALWEGHLSRAGSVASAHVERESPAAPQDVRNEAVIRFSGYLLKSDLGAVSSRSLGPISTEYVVNHAPMFRNCGAKGLLAPWKVRHAGVIG